MVTIGNELLRGAGEYRLLLLGVIVVAVIIMLPNGIAGIRARWYAGRRTADGKSAEEARERSA